MARDEGTASFPELMVGVGGAPVSPPAVPVISTPPGRLDRTSAPKPPPVPASAQLLLGADKRHPVFSVYHDEDNQQLLVYYSLEILEIGP